MKQKKTIGIWATGGGPTGGRAILGMLKYLEEIGLYPERIKVIGGTSIGAYTLTGAFLGWKVEKMIEKSFLLTNEVVTTPNFATKVGFFDIELALKFLQREIFNGSNPKLNTGTIPMVIASANWRTLEVRYQDDDETILETLRLAISNPVYFNLDYTDNGIVGDAGIVSNVGVNYLRGKHGVEHTILLDVQSGHTWKGVQLDEPLPIFSQLLLWAAKILGGRQFSKRISLLVHFRYTVDVIVRAVQALFTQMIDLEIEKQKPTVVMKLEDIIDIEQLGLSAFDEEVGMEQVEYGYQAAKLKEKELKALL